MAPTKAAGTGCDTGFLAISVLHAVNPHLFASTFLRAQETETKSKIETEAEAEVETKAKTERDKDRE